MNDHKTVMPLKFPRCEVEPRCGVRELAPAVLPAAPRPELAKGRRRGGSKPGGPLPVETAGKRWQATAFHNASDLPQAD